MIMMTYHRFFDIQRTISVQNFWRPSVPPRWTQIASRQQDQRSSPRLQDVETGGVRRDGWSSIQINLLRLLLCKFYHPL